MSAEVAADGAVASGAAVAVDGARASGAVVAVASASSVAVDGAVASGASVAVDGALAGVPAGRRGATPPRLVAHRGAPRVRRENTLPAVAVAEALGAETIEVDVRRTADDVAVLLHDETLGRMWGDARAVAEVPWCEVARLGNGLDRIPRLDAVLDRLDGCRSTLLVDLVDPADALVAARTVAATTVDTGVAWCGSPEAMTAVRSVLPDADVWLAWTALEPPTPDDLVALAPTTLNLDVAFLTPATVEAAHRLGLRVAVWTVDDVFY